MRLDAMIAQPLLAILPAVVFFFLYLWTKHRTARLASILWMLYVPYELAMKFRILCSGECNIRVDLLLIYPLLALVSMLALGFAVAEFIKRCRAQ